VIGADESLLPKGVSITKLKMPVWVAPLCSQGYTRLVRATFFECRAATTAKPSCCSPSAQLHVSLMMATLFTRPLQSVSVFVSAICRDAQRFVRRISCLLDGFSVKDRRITDLPRDTSCFWPCHCYQKGSWGSCCRGGSRCSFCVLQPPRQASPLFGCLVCT
jgi:hypothetical protein